MVQLKPGNMICPNCKKDKERTDFSWCTWTPNPTLKYKHCKQCLSEIKKQKKLEEREYGKTFFG